MTFEIKTAGDKKPYYITPARWRSMQGTPSTQPAPPPAASTDPNNLIDAAKQTAQGNLENAQAATAANRPTQNTPFGQIKWTKDAAGNWTMDTSLSPQLQGLFGLQTGAASDVLANLPKSPINAGQTAQDAIMSRLQPQLDRQRGQLENQLANQGFSRGSEGYKTALTDENQRENDLYINAALQGLNLDVAAPQNQANLANTLLGGAQGVVPQQSSYPLQATTGGADIYSALAQQMGLNQSASNASRASKDNLLSGLFGLGAGALAGGLLSDRRLKTNIKRIGTHRLGVGVYEYDIFDRHEVGVMAQELLEVLPEAVTMGDDGYYRVNYGLL